MRVFFRRFCIAALAISLTAFVPDGEADLPHEHAYWQALEEGACEDAGYALTPHFQEARLGLRALLGTEKDRWMKGGRLVRFPALAYCEARRDLRMGMERYIAAGLSTPMLSKTLEFPELLPNEDYADWRENVHDGILTLKHLADVLYGPALLEWAQLFTDGTFVNKRPEEAFELLVMAERLGVSAQPDLVKDLSGHLTSVEQQSIRQVLKADIPDMALERATEIELLESFWAAQPVDRASDYQHEIEGYAAALNVGECERARALAVAETEDIDVSAYLDGPQDPWDQVSPKYDPALFQCRAEVLLARGEVLAAASDLTVLADLLYDPALLTLAKIYSDGQRLPADPRRAYRYLVLAEGFGAADSALRQSLEGALSDSTRAEIDEYVTQGWPDLFRNLRETGKAGLFVGPQRGLTSGD